MQVSGALLGRVPPNLRGVTGTVDDTLVHVRYYFDGAISPGDWEEMSVASTEVISHYLDHKLKEEIIRCDAPLPMEQLDRWMYLRSEEPFHLNDANEAIQGTNFYYPDLLWYLQQALLGEVTPPLRGVTAGVQNGVITVVCYFDRIITSQDESLVTRLRSAIAKVYTQYSVTVSSQHLPSPLPMPPLDCWAYRRHESN